MSTCPLWRITIASRPIGIDSIKFAVFTRYESAAADIWRKFSQHSARGHGSLFFAFRTSAIISGRIPGHAHG
jgi:hypothetical protein